MLSLPEQERYDFVVVLAATLTRLGLLNGFRLSMAVSRYDQRRNDEEAEANAISTVYGRADQLPANDASWGCVGCGGNMSISACCSTRLGTRKGLRK